LTAVAPDTAAGTALGSALGRAAGVADVAGLATVAPLGKKVALWPLYTCHWSQSKTMEKPKTTHKTVRRISFMKTSCVWKEKKAG
jgi:hypothetical protein